MYVLGNVIALCSTGFLVGPKNQCKKMFDETRRWSAVFYLVMLITVFAVALAVRHPPFHAQSSSCCAPSCGQALGLR